jgi:hypothetical protein
MYGFCAYHEQSQRCRLRLLMRREEGAHSFPSFETPIPGPPSLSLGNLWLVISLIVVQVMLACRVRQGKRSGSTQKASIDRELSKLKWGALVCIPILVSVNRQGGGQFENKLVVIQLDIIKNL